MRLQIGLEKMWRGKWWSPPRKRQKDRGSEEVGKKSFTSKRTFENVGGWDARSVVMTTSQKTNQREGKIISYDKCPTKKNEGLNYGPRLRSSFEKARTH